MNLFKKILKTIKNGFIIFVTKLFNLLNYLLDKTAVIFKNIFKYLGLFFKEIFTVAFNVIKFLLDNTIGLVFNRAFSRYNKHFDKSKLWYKVRSIILLVALLVFIFGFKFIYNHTLGQLFGLVITSFSKLFHIDNLYHKILSNYGYNFADGIGTTIYLALIGTTSGFIIAIFFSLLVTLKDYPSDNTFIHFFKRLGRGIVKVYVTVLRGTPMMVQAMIIYWGVKVFVNWDYLIAALVVVSLNTGAYLTEVLKGGIESVDKGQLEGGLSLGLSPYQTMMSIVFPQAIKNSMASIGNEFVINIKDTSVLSVILVVDLFRVAQIAQARYTAGFEPYIIVAILYLILTFTVTSILKRASKVLDVPVIELPSAN